MKITGHFDVTLTPLDSHAQGKNNMLLARMAIEKQFHGELHALSTGEMLSARTPMEGSAGYVAIEQVDGTLSGKQGTFVLQHFGTMDRGKERLILEVVPDSGTGELQGVIGIMSIHLDNGKHLYDFEFDFE